jgi:GntR family transcriptional regulator
MNKEAVFPVDQLAPLDAGSFVPLYRQVAQRIASGIREQGERAVGKVLPSEAEFMQRFGVSRPTVRQAMAHLISQGLVTRVRGRGTFVTPLRLEHDVSHGFEDDMQAAHKQVDYTLLAWKRVQSPPAVAAVFKQHGNGYCFYLQRLRGIEGEVIGVEERYLPEHIGSRLAEKDLDSQPVLKLIRDLDGRKPGKLEIEVSSTVAAKDMARLLKVRIGAPLLLRNTVFLTEAGEPLMQGTVTFLAEHYKFRFVVNYVA